MEPFSAYSNIVVSESMDSVRSHLRHVPRGRCRFETLRIVDISESVDADIRYGTVHYGFSSTWFPGFYQGSCRSPHWIVTNILSQYTRNLGMA